MKTIKYLKGRDSDNSVEDIILVVDKKPEFIKKSSGDNAMYDWESCMYKIEINGRKFIIEKLNHSEIGGSWVTGDRQYQIQLFYNDYDEDLAGPLGISEWIPVKFIIDGEQYNGCMPVWTQEWKIEEYNYINELEYNEAFIAV